MWEYKIAEFDTKGGIFSSGIRGNMEKELNKLGKEDWELIGTFVTTTGHGSVNKIHAVLKRKK